MESRRAWLWLAAAALLPATGCSSLTVETAHADGVPVTTPTVVDGAASDGLEDYSNEMPLVDRDESAVPVPDGLDGDGSYAAYEPLEFHTLTYHFHPVIAPDDSSSVAPADVRAETPFGMPPGSGTLTLWSAAGESDSPWVSPVIWPSECIGIAPDIDGDGLLDDCDPYPKDGPLADFDGDEILNPDDNCPIVSNADQEWLFEPSSGLDRSDLPPGTACFGTEAFLAFEPVWATVTLESWNEQRRQRGLDPIVMPEGYVDLPTNVNQWCNELAALNQEDFWAPGFALELPEEYGLSVAQTQRFDELLTQFWILEQISFGYYQNGVPEPEDAGIAEYERFVEDMARYERGFTPYQAVLSSSDLACR